MFADKRKAEEILLTMLEVSGILNESVRDVQKACSTAEFEEYRGYVGRTMGEIFWALRALGEAYPDLTAGLLNDEASPEWRSGEIERRLAHRAKLSER